MLFRDPNKPELVVEVPENGKAPKAVVLLLGWFGSKHRHVRKYSELYEQRGCATITAIVDSRSLIVFDLVKVDEFSVCVAKEAAKLLRRGDKIPLLCHVFSNGGAIPLQRMEGMMDENIQNGTDDVEDWKLLKERLEMGVEVFDSSPAFVDMDTFRQGIKAALPTNAIISFIVFCISAAYFQAWGLCRQLQGEEPWETGFWKHWVTKKFAPVQAYVYSTADTTTKSSKLDELIKIKEDMGVKVTVKRFDDSLHCQHMLKHKTEYLALIDEIVSKL